jgi:hypothetical protein
VYDSVDTCVLRVGPLGRKNGCARNPEYCTAV